MRAKRVKVFDFFLKLNDFLKVTDFKIIVGRFQILSDSHIESQGRKSMARLFSRWQSSQIGLFPRFYVLFSHCQSYHKWDWILAKWTKLYMRRRPGLLFLALSKSHRSSSEQITVFFLDPFFLLRFLQLKIDFHTKITFDHFWVHFRTFVRPF